MLPEIYSFDADTRVWRRKDVRAFAYTDGDSIEQRIAEIIRNSSDLSVQSSELERAITDWPSLYHLGRGRINLLLPFADRLGGDTLEIGCGCGAITRALGEFGGQVLAVEGSGVRAAIAASRCRDLPNVSVVHESFDRFECDDRFDVVTLIGVLEYARKYFNVPTGKDPVVAMLEAAKRFLRPGGVLLLAIENQLGLKYFAGSPEDHVGIPMYGVEDLYLDNDVVTFGEQELRGLLRISGFQHQAWWYPFPDYKFPVSVFSEAAVTNPCCDLSPLLQDSALADPQRTPATVFSLESAWSPVFRNGLAGALANSFAVLGSEAPFDEPSEQVLAVHYASARRSAYAKQVRFVRSQPGGAVQVQHQPLFAAPDKESSTDLHIQFEETDFVGGRHWQKELVRILNRPGWNLDEVADWARVWFDAFKRHAGLEVPAVFDKLTPVAANLFDAVPRNLIVKDANQGVFIDQEWLYEAPCVLGFVVFRAIGLSFFGVTSVAQPAEGVSLSLSDLTLSLAARLGVQLSAVDLAAYIREEGKLQARVSPGHQSPLTETLFDNWTLNVRRSGSNALRIAELESEISRKERELHALGDEVHRLESFIADKVAALGGVSGELMALHRALDDKHATIAQQGSEIERLEAFAAEKQEAVSTLSGELSRLSEMLARQGSEVGRLEAFAAEKQEVVSTLSGELSCLHESLAQQSSEIKRLEAFAAEKQEAVNTLSGELLRLLESSSRQSSEIERLEAFAAEKQDAVNSLSSALSRVNETRAQQDAEIGRLEAFAAEKQQVVRVLSTEVARLNDAVVQKQGELDAASLELRRLHEAFAEKEQVVFGQGEAIARLQALLREKEREMNTQTAVMKERIDGLQLALTELEAKMEAERLYFYAEVQKRDVLLEQTSSQFEQTKLALSVTAGELNALKQTRWFRLREVLLFQPFGLRKTLHLLAIVGGGVLPRTLRQKVGPRFARALGLGGGIAEASTEAAYCVRQPPKVAVDAPRVVHVIANFMTGGSSRLVVDLIEHLGDRYRQRILTSYIPDPPAYVGIDIEECRFPEDPTPFLDYFGRTKPDFVHVHYWGDCDEPWYAKAIEAARRLHLPVIENINTPIAPHHSDAVVKYVYVSDYVRQVFGDQDPRHVTVYPGSNFDLFTRKRGEHAPDDCVGMVYRLERDKLNEESIQPFIRIAQMRPQTRVLIVGGGSLLEPFQAAVSAAGVTANFEFTGYVSYEALPSLYRRMSLFVAPVWKESFGQVSPFAMSMKVPVIGYDVGAIGEIVADPALLAPAADAEALARVAVGLLDAPDRRRQLGEMQQMRARDHFSVQAMIDNYAGLYADVARNTRKEPL